MDDAAPRGHPLHRARLEQSFIPLVVAVAHPPGQHDGHRLEAAMWMVRKAADIGVGIVGSELVEQEEGVERLEVRPADHPGQLHPRPIAGSYTAQLPRERPWLMDK